MGQSEQTFLDCPSVLIQILTQHKDLFCVIASFVQDIRQIMFGIKECLFGQQVVCLSGVCWASFCSVWMFVAIIQDDILQTSHGACIRLFPWLQQKDQKMDLSDLLSSSKTILLHCCCQGCAQQRTLEKQACREKIQGIEWKETSECSKDCAQKSSSTS